MNVPELPAGRVATEMFSEELAELRQKVGNLSGPPLSQDNVLQWAMESNQPFFAGVCRRLLLPGSRIQGLESLVRLYDLAQQGRSCLFCLNHRSNLDVPALYTLLGDVQQEHIFHRILWIAGRKLVEESELTRILARAFHRLVITPHTWFEAADPEVDDLPGARLLNKAAFRIMLTMRQQGWIVGLFPAGTRQRPGQQASSRAIPEIDTYIKSFDHLLLGHIDGCPLPVADDSAMIHEVPRQDRVVFRLGTVWDTGAWRRQAAERHEPLSQRQATARAIMEDIDALGAE